MAGTFGEVLATFKKREEPENIYPLLDDVPLCNAVVAWKSVVISFKSMEECQSDEENTKWEWLWSRVEFDVSMFGIVAGCKAQEAAVLHARLRGLRLIYPDGSINNYAKQYLGQLIIQKLAPKGRRAAPPTPPPQTP